MIESNAQLQQTREALSLVEDALAALRVRIEAKNPALFVAMAEDYVSDIRRLRREIDEYVGTAVSVESNVPLWMVLEGEAVSRHEISSRLLSEWLGNFRKSIYGLTAYLQTGRVRLTGGRPDPILLSATDPHVAALAPGSIRIGLKLPAEAYQGDLFDHDATNAVSKPVLAVQQLMSVASWASSGKTELPATDMDPDGLSVAARFASKLAPSPRSAVRNVSFSGPMIAVDRPVTLNAESRERLEGLTRLLSHVTEETVHGLIREIDLDARRVILRERGEGLSDIKCYVPESLMETAQSLLNQQVSITGLISSASPDIMNAKAIGDDSSPYR